MDDYQYYIHKSRYARFLDDKARRENWDETIQRLVDFYSKKFPQHTEVFQNEIRQQILDMRVMPSMRSLMAAGPALERDDVAAYNCSYLSMDNIKAFSEALFVLMNGVGVGFSVERQYIAQLPVVAEEFYDSDTIIQVKDSKIGWATSFHELITLLYQGRVPKWDLSKLRPAGARLKTFGGRSSGPEPLNDLFEFCVSVFRKAVGRKLNSLEVHDIMCKIGTIVVVGGVRRSALISLSNLSDERMRNAKNGQWWDDHVHRALANNSVAYTEKPDIGIFMKEWLTLYDSKSGERGIFNRVAAINQAKATGRREYEGQQFGVNPCLTADTLVYVADGRGDVSIKELADAGNDVPVFCLNDENKIVIRTMRAPRITGTNSPVFKVTLDDGSVIKTTDNHKFKLKSGEYKEVKDLSPGDSLSFLTKKEATFGEIFKNSNKSQDYIWITNNGRHYITEHSVIASFHNNIDCIPKKHVVHHCDYDSRNNMPSNLKIMLREDHTKLHTDHMFGDSNPMRRAKIEWTEAQWNEYKKKLSVAQTGENNGNANPVTNEELKNHVLELTKKKGYKLTKAEWIEYASQNNLPQSFSKYRKDHLNGINGYFKWAALELGYDNVNLDAKTMKKYKSLLNEGYDCDIVNNKVVINKVCEICNNHFTTTNKEHGVCSIECANTKRFSDEDYKKTYSNKISASLATRKLKICSNMSYEPSKSQAVMAWKSGFLGNTSNIKTVKNYTELKETSKDYNRKVVSVEFNGYEDVYNGTVDEFHNFFVGGFVSQSENGKKKVTYLNNRQCGEILLRPNEFCNLTEVVARETDTLDDLKEKVKYATILGTFQSTFTNFRYIRSIWKKNCEEERLLGVSLTGIMDHPVLSGREGAEKLTHWLSEMKQCSIDTNKIWSEKLGINQSASLTCTKPSGTVSQLVNSASGIHPRYSKYYIRTVRQDKKDPLGQFLKDQGVPCEDDVTKPGSTWVFSFPQKSANHSVFRDEISAIQQLEHYMIYKKYWCEHNPSITVYVREHEWMEVGAWVYKNFADIGGVSFLPHSDHAYKQAPYEEITEAKYNELVEKFPKIQWELFNEDTDNVEGVQALACSAGVCEI